MSRLAEAQADFASALTDPQRPLPGGLSALGRPACTDRFAVYRNNVMVALIEALVDSFPVTRRLVGDEFFRAMAAAFARANRPRSPVMHEYGNDFPTFIASYEPAASVPYLGDVARLERALVESYHAPEAEALGDPRSPQGSLRLHPAVRLVRSPFPIFTIWDAHTDGARPGHLRLAQGGEDVLIARPDVEVRACIVPREVAELVEAGAADRAVPDTDLPASARLASLGALTHAEAMQ